MKGNLFWNLMTRLASAAGIVFAVLLATLGLAWSSDGVTRPRWNQEEALKKVQAVIAQEQTNDFAWDKIDWVTDANEAAMRAQREKKPIFLYFFLRKETGPAAAPS